MARRDDRTGLLPVGHGTVHVPASLSTVTTPVGGSLCGRVPDLRGDGWVRPNVDLPVCYWCTVKLAHIADSIDGLVALVESGRVGAGTIRQVPS